MTMRPLFDTDLPSDEVKADLPRPARSRWQPLRSGLLNLYRFDYEEFWFEDGHLLLKGNNGTGKSRVLALQLPFLLDGDTSPERVEPDADQAKKMEWNLLLGMHQERSGYTWLEFGRRTPSGEDAFFTIGCGLTAVAGRGSVGRWYFVTSQRVGRDLFLQARSGQVLSRERLAEEIGASGNVFTTAAEYRQAIDKALFRLGKQQYDALIDLLIKLRQPKLSRNLDEKVLSKALSEALPPLSSQILADVAESFRTLESDRTALATFSAAHGSVEQFLNEYRRYVRIAARRRADDVRRAQAAYELTMRNLRKAEADRDAADVEVQALIVRLKAIEIDEGVAETSVQTLQNSPQMADAQALEAARRQVGERRDAALAAEQDFQRADRNRIDSAARREQEREEAAKSHDELEVRAHAALARAGETGLETEHRKAAHAVGLPDPSDLESLPEPRRRLDEAVEQRAQAIRHIRGLNRQVESARQALGMAKELQDNVASQLDGALSRQKDSHAARDAAIAALIGRYRAWVKAVSELAPADPDLVGDDLLAWSESGTGESPVSAAIRAAELEAARSFAALRQQFDQRLATADEELAGLRAQYDALQAGVHEPPPAPHTRNSAARATRPGAPLWLLCDFAPHIPAVERAGIEAALEAAGLLDAWVTPDGRLLAADEHDAVLAVRSSPLAPEGQSLDQILIPSVDRGQAATAGLADDTVRAVLRHIGSGEAAGHVWVDASGRWQVGPLHGAYAKQTAEHIGQSAREARRRQRLAEIALAIDAAENVVQQIRGARAAIDERERKMHAETAAAPHDDALRQARSSLVSTAQEVVRQREQLVKAEQQVATRTQEWQRTVDQRARDAADLGIAAWVETLDQLDSALQAYRGALVELWPVIRQHIQARERVARAAQQAEEAAENAAHSAARWQEAKGKSESVAEHYRVLHESVGAVVEEILRRLDVAKVRRDELRRERGVTEAQRSNRKTELALAQQDVDRYSASLDADASGRDVAVSHFKDFVATKLLRLALRDATEGELTAASSNTRVVDAARSMELELADVVCDEPVWERSQNAVYKRTEELKTALSSQGYQPEAGTEGGVFVVSMPFQGRSLTMLELRDALADEIRNRQMLLNAREREILETHLIGEVALHLHDLLHTAEQWVLRMNEELRQRPTSAGMRLRFVWRPADDAPAGMPEARKRLLRADGTWSPAEREALGSFLQQQIQAVRAENSIGTWQEHLAQALDYRNWHCFDIERNQDGQWKRLTRRTHGTGSGGEKAIALTIPQFAAAAAHYSSADSLAPRLILLDEAFVGVDADMRRKCMGLLAAFDLDFVMTSEREWGCYDTLPGLAIHHLSSRAGIDAVHVTRWVWNGRERRQEQPVLPSAMRPDAEDLDKVQVAMEPGDDKPGQKPGSNGSER